MKLGSILNFNDLCQKFKAQHVAKTRVKKGNIALFTITQTKNTLSEYNYRFMNGLCTIFDLDNGIALYAYTIGLKINPL